MDLCFVKSLKDPLGFFVLLEPSKGLQALVVLCQISGYINMFDTSFSVLF